MDLKINLIDALKLGIRMGDNFMDELGKPSAMKDYVTNSSRLKDGVTIDASNAKVDKREITLTFNIEGSSQKDFETKKRAFYELLYVGEIDICVPVRSADIYHLVYTGKSISYAQNRGGTFCKLSVKFIEPNPKNRI